MVFEDWSNNHWKVNVRDGFDGEKCYDLNTPSVNYSFNEHDFLQLAHNINSIAEHIYDKKYYYIHDGDIFRRDGGQLLGVIEDCEELNRLYDENTNLYAELYAEKTNTAEVVNKYAKQFKRHSAEFSFMVDLAEDLGVDVKELEAKDD